MAVRARAPTAEVVEAEARADGAACDCARFRSVHDIVQSIAAVPMSRAISLPPRGASTRLLLLLGSLVAPTFASVALGGRASSTVTRTACRRVPTPSMGFMDQLAAAFENDDTLGEAGPAGLKKKVQTTTITWRGPPPEGMEAMFKKQDVTTQQAVAGQKLKDLAQSAGIPLSYSCMKVGARA